MGAFGDSYVRVAYLHCDIVLFPFSFGEGLIVLILVSSLISCKFILLSIFDFYYHLLKLSIKCFLR